MLVAIALFFGWRPRRHALQTIDGDSVDVARVARGGGAASLPMPPQSPTSVGAFLLSLGALDWVLFGYLVMLLVVCVNGEGVHRDTAIRSVELCLVIFGTGVVLQRAQILRGAPGAIAYRLAIFGGLFGSFLELHHILPTASARVVDAQILLFDQRVFHYEPAIAWDRFVTPHTTEWFAFFYYGYFCLLALHVLPMMFVERRMDVLGAFALGIITLYCVSHTLYMVVPAYGPWVELKGKFAHELEGPLWWPLVRKTVDAAGARKDVFPSLHTGGPTFIAVFSFLHRKRLPFKYTWPLTAFFASQIIIATMFLRWHYLVDIVAGLVISISIGVLSPKVIAWERARRERLGIPAAWPELWTPR